VTDVKRLGKRGSYRLGRLRAQGIADLASPMPLRPSFTRPRHSGPTFLWLIAALAGAAVITLGAARGLWFMPFAVGLLAGLANRVGGWRVRVLVVAVGAMALVGWGVPFWWPASHGEPAAAARVVTGLAGVPVSAVAGVAAVLLTAILQALTGLWLGCALTPRPTSDLPGVGALLLDRLQFVQARLRLSGLAADLTHQPDPDPDRVDESAEHENQAEAEDEGGHDRACRVRLLQRPDHARRD
jgi:hypothetical protein